MQLARPQNDDPKKKTKKTREQRPAAMLKRLSTQTAGDHTTTVVLADTLCCITCTSSLREWRARVCAFGIYL